MVAKTISGPAYSKANVLTAIANLKPSHNDIVVFYYSGHGFRKQPGNRRFPSINLKTHFTTRQDVVNNSLNMEDIFAMIQKKRARFNLVLSDCCNSDIETINSTGTNPAKTKGSGIQWDEDNCRNLFLNTAAQSILATAADNGQRASSNNNFGGFFSYYFQSSMENYCSKLKNNVSWDQVLQDAKTQTINKAKHTYCDKPYIPENICNQYPYYIIR
jgi:Caspase domain